MMEHRRKHRKDFLGKMSLIKTFKRQTGRIENEESISDHHSSRPKYFGE